MDPTVSVVVVKEKVDRFQQFLRDLYIAGEPTRYVAKEAGFFDLIFGQTDLDPTSRFITLRGEDAPHADFGMEVTKVDEEAGSTGYHLPEGLLMIYDPADTSVKKGRTRIEATEVAPSLLNQFGLEVPSYMTPPSVMIF